MMLCGVMSEDFQTWESWHTRHQPYELAWWKEALKNGHSVEDASFELHWEPVKDFINPKGTVLDIGCGPRPPFASGLYGCVVIEPLAVEYREITPSEWWQGVMFYAQPAEQQIEALIGCFDTVICWNCIDHAIGWREILDNMASYGHSYGTIYGLATDFHEPFLGHPGFERDEFMFEVEKRFEILEHRAPFGRDLALRMRRKQGERQ